LNANKIECIFEVDDGEELASLGAVEQVIDVTNFDLYFGRV
jgi:hypothetical protein